MAQQVRQMNASADQAVYRPLKTSSKDVRRQPTLHGDLRGGISVFPPLRKLVNSDVYARNSVATRPTVQQRSRASKNVHSGESGIGRPFG
jgi:hypothetical protein